MFALVLTLCLKSDSAQCFDRIIAWLPAASASTCQQQGAPLVTEWAKQNADVIVQNAACLRPRG